jgi:hypothetical protein
VVGQLRGHPDTSLGGIGGDLGAWGRGAGGVRLA